MMFMFRSLALIAVHKHKAASKSASPCSTGQHLSVAPEPMPMWIRPPNKSTHASSFRVLMGHVGALGGGGGHGTSGAGGMTFGGGGGTTFGGGGVTFGGEGGTTLGGGGGLTFGGGGGGFTFGGRCGGLTFGGGGQGTSLGGGGGDGIGYGQ